MTEDDIWILMAKKLSGEASEEELVELDKLFTENPELRYPAQQIANTWSADGIKHDRQEAHDAMMRHIQRMKDLGMDFNDHHEDEADEPKPGLYNKRKYLWPALAASLIIGSLFFGIRYFGTGEKQATGNSGNGEAKQAVSQISTRNNSKTKITLSDGTVVWLNAGSTLSYDSSYNENLREVVLTGEAYFDVVKNKNKPFIIHASKINIKVLGTVFNVRSYASDKTTEASLIRGSIEVSFQNNPNNKIILKPNEKIVVDNENSKGTISGNPVAESGRRITGIPNVAIKSLTHEHGTGDIIETSWVANKLIFQDESFDQIAHQFERWYGVTIVFKNGRLMENHLTGNFTNESIRQALDALKLTASFKYEIDNNNLVTIY